MRVLVTGVSGFVGGHVVDFLRRLEPEPEVLGLDSRPGNRARALGIPVVQADLTDRAEVEHALAQARPDRILHLAAQSSPQRSWEDPAGTFNANVLGLLHLLEALRACALRPRVLVIGSAEEYGRVSARDLPLREDAPLRPTTPYAVSKVAQSYLALQYALSRDVQAVRTRTFHHTGPRRADSFAEGSFARQIAEAEAGRRAPVLEVGNLDVVRDFTDVRDVVEAYWLLLEKGAAGEVYNVCSGRGVRLRQIVDELQALARCPIEVRVDAARVRKADVPEVVGDAGRLRALTGWEPAIPLRRSLADLLDHWRERVGVAATAP